MKGSGSGQGETKPLDQESFFREGPRRRFLEPRLLYLIREKPGHGYGLVERARALPFPGPAPDTAAIYRMLRDLERRGLVTSEWREGVSGPRQRVYRITPEGMARLEEWLRALKERVALLNRFIAMCEGGG